MSLPYIWYILGKDNHISLPCASTFCKFGALLFISIAPTHLLGCSLAEKPTKYSLIPLMGQFTLCTAILYKIIYYIRATSILSYLILQIWWLMLSVIGTLLALLEIIICISFQSLLTYFAFHIECSTPLNCSHLLWKHLPPAWVLLVWDVISIIRC